MSDMDRMLREIEEEVLDTRDLLGKRTLSPDVMSALRAVPREIFVSPDQRGLAYANTALAIDCGQTISQPYIVAVMTDVLALSADDRVLEIGTGSGYQTAILALLSSHVFSMELTRELSLRAQARLAALDLDNIEFRVGDGHFGWPEAAPFDKIMVTAAAREIPPSLCEQLATGGIMVLPVETSPGRQVLTRVEKRSLAALEARPFLPVAFVPLRREVSRDDVARRGTHAY